MAHYGKSDQPEPHMCGGCPTDGFTFHKQTWYNNGKLDINNRMLGRYRPIYCQCILVHP